MSTQTIRPVAACLAALAVALAGCGRDGQQARAEQKVYRPPAAPRDELTPGQQAALIMQRVGDQSCVKGQAAAGDIHSSDAEAFKLAKELDDWFERTVRSHPQTYPLVEAKREGPGWNGVGYRYLAETFAYQEDGRDIELRANKTWGTAQGSLGSPRGDYPYMKVQISFCSLVPDLVEILSTSGDSASGWIGVQYRLAWKNTVLAQSFVDAGMPNLNVPMPPSISGTATLQRTGPGQWDVQLQ